MRYLILIAGFLFVVHLNAQVEKIRIKKEKTNDGLTKICLGGVVLGEVTLKKLSADPKFTILNNPGKYKVYFAILKFTDGEGKYTEWVNSTEELNNTFLNYLLSPRASSQTKLMITDIKARDDKEEELKLNDILITITK